jgi:hypothetical protein
MVTSKGNLKERIPGKAPIRLIGNHVAQPHPFVPLVKWYMAAVISPFSYGRSLIPFVFQYISLPCHCCSSAHLQFPFVHMK